MKKLRDFENKFEEYLHRAAVLSSWNLVLSDAPDARRDESLVLVPDV